MEKIKTDNTDGVRNDHWDDISSLYKFKHFLGKGTFGEVRKATCLMTQKEYAIKYIKL